MKRFVIKAKYLFDGITKYENKFIIIEDNKIIDIKNSLKKFDYEGIVTPGFIDPHSHIGMCREGEPSEEGESNEISSQIQPLLNPLNSIYFDDRAFLDSLDFGVMYSCVVPGSGNLIGGKAVIVNHNGRDRRTGYVKDYGYKMALGYNPRSTTAWKGDRPNTRMGLYALLENKFDSVILKRKKEERVRDKRIDEIKNDKKIKDKKKKIDEAQVDYDLSFTSEEEAIIELLSGKKIAKVHVHKIDDVYYMLDLVKKYKLKVTLEHGEDIFEQYVFEDLKKNNIPVVYGPLISLGYKTELKHAHFNNVSKLMKSGCQFGLMTDHPVIHSLNLRDCLKYFLIQGMKEEEAISLITGKNAKILGMDKNIGILKKGSLASLIIWNKSPFYLGAMPQKLIFEGKIIK